MHKFEKLLLLSGVSASLFLGLGVNATSVYANTKVDQVDSTILGGWNEETGKFSNQNSNLTPGISRLRAANSGPIHNGKRENRFRKDGLESRAVASTTWPGVYHYSRAQMVGAYGRGRVNTDSGRVWARNGTQAYSPWVFEGEIST
ncbi:TPA: hypothetical protein ACHVGM_002103, partial [Streptococcus suis]